jgi:hypothetical protein
MAMEMIDTKLNLLVRSLGSAVALESVDRINELLNAIDLHLVRDGAGEEGRIFGRMMELLETSKDSGDPAWQVFTWILSKYGNFSDSQKKVLRRYVVDSYPKFGSDLLVSEAAEWVGGWCDGEAVEAIRSWIEMWEHLLPGARRGIGSALSEILDKEKNSTEEIYLVQAADLKALCDRLMREDRLRNTPVP